MSENGKQAAFDYLLSLANRQGYVTIDDITDTADRWHLPICEVDWLSNSIISEGIIVYDGTPEKSQGKEDKKYFDFAQCDYEAVFKRVVELDPSLQTFIDYLKQIKPPQHREFGILVHQAKEGNEHARKRIIEMYLRYAIRIALQWAEQYDTCLADCIGEASVGLLKALDRYDPDTCGAFGAYASMWILQNIAREQNTKRPTIYYPAYKKGLFNIMYPILRNKGCTECERVWNCSKVKRLVKERIKCTDTEAEEIILAVFPLDSLEALVEKGVLDCEDDFDRFGEDDRSRLLFCLISRDDLPEIVAFNILQEQLDETLKSLAPRERKVIKLRFGLEDGIERTLSEIGLCFGVSRERIRQIEAKALRRLRHPSRSRKLKDFL